MLKRIIAISLVMLILGCFSFSASALSIDSGMYIQSRMGIQEKIPALMYHKVTDNPAEVTEWVVTGKMLADDFAEIKERGYTPITVSDYYKIKKLSRDLFVNENYKVVANFFKNNPKPIIITFDDGYKGIYTHVLPLMKQYNFKVNFYLCGELIDTQNPEYCTWEDIKTINASGLAEFGNHTYALHAKNKDDLFAMYLGAFDEVLADLNKNRSVIAANTGVDSKVISFPYGRYDEVSIVKLKNAGYEAFVSTDYRVNIMNDNELALGRFNRDTVYTTEAFFNLVDSKCQTVY